MGMRVKRMQDNRNEPSGQYTWRARDRDVSALVLVPLGSGSRMHCLRVHEAAASERSSQACVLFLQCV